jgi:hypothetical protein
MSDREDLSPFVKSREGEMAQEKSWRELEGKLEKINPGIMNFEKWR